MTQKEASFCSTSTATGTLSRSSSLLIAPDEPFDDDRDGEIASRLIVQVLISRGERVLGLKYGAFFQDEGCRDPNFVKHWNENHAGMRETNVTFENTYDAASTSALKQCYSDRCVVRRAVLPREPLQCRLQCAVSCVCDSPLHL